MLGYNSCLKLEQDDLCVTCKVLAKKQQLLFMKSDLFTYSQFKCKENWNIIIKSNLSYLYNEI